MTSEAAIENRPYSGKPLAIIGIGCLFPKADNHEAYWANIREGVDSITDIPVSHWQTSDYYDQDPKSPDRTYGNKGGFLSPVQFNPMEFNLPPNTLEAIDTSQLLGLVAAGQALKDAGYGPDREFNRSRVSVILGVTGTLELVIPLGARLGHPLWRAALKEAGVDDTVAEDVVARISDSYVPWQENSFPGLLGNVVAGRISKQYDLGGTNCVVDAACASSLSALHLASLELAAGKSDMVITGGVDTFNDIFMYTCFSKTPALSPTGNAKPFDASGDGTILGEGLGIVVVKRLADAERDGDRIYAVIRGIGTSSDGKGEAIYTPSAAGQKKALLDAYDQAGVSPDSIGLIEAHGTGTKVGDAVEVSALREVFGEAETPRCALGSVKSQIGHTKAAAGSAGLIKAALALYHKVIPPTIKVSQPLDEVTSGRTPFYLATEKRPWLSEENSPRRAGVSAFGFGGSNFHAVLEEYRPSKETAEWDGDIQILAFAGSSASELDEAVSEIPADLAWNDLRARASILRTNFEPAAPCRLALVVERQKTNLAEQFAQAQAMLRKNPNSPWQTPGGVFYATGAPPGKLGMLFPGQGAQYTGMLKDLACTFPEMHRAIARADSGFVAPGSGLLSDRIYPVPTYTTDARGVQEEELRATDIAQPAIGAVSLGALRILESFGIHPDAVAGHSYGELTALCAAGRLDETAFHKLSRLRGKLMASGNGDKGSMLAVPAPLSTVEAVIREENLDLVIANRNAPAQAVLSGSSAEIDRAASAFAARKLSCKRLPVAAAFHSSLVADAAGPFLKALAKIDLHEALVPVYSNTTGAPYPDDQAAAKALLAGQLAQPVEFVAEIEALYAAGIRTFVEVGPGARLTGLVKAIVGDRDHQVIPLDASSGNRSGMADLARAIAQLAVLGHGVRIAAWDNEFQPGSAAGARKPAMTIPICGANYVKPRPKRPPVQPRATMAPPPLSHPAAPTPTPTAAATVARLSEPVSAASRDTLQEAVRVTRESMAVLQKMQEETALLHRRFLEGQETASRTIHTLLQQQQRLTQGNSAPAVHASQAAVMPALTAAPTRVETPAPPVAPPAQPSIMLPAASPEPANDITRILLAVVAEKTGYPMEMLEPEMGLDSDLGIDSIKRVEILSALQEKLPEAPVIGPEHLGTLSTLAEIAGFLGSAPSSSKPSRTNRQESTPANDVAATLLGVVAEKTGYPLEMLELEMGLDSDLGIDSIKRVEILSALQEKLPEAPVIGPEQLGSLNSLGDIVGFLCTSPRSGGGAVLPLPKAADNPVSDVTGILLAVVAEKTGYPVEMLDPAMSLDSDLGIDSIKRVEILSALQEQLPGSPVIGPEHLGTLNSLGEIAGFLGAATPAAARQEPRQPGATNRPAATDVTGLLLAVVAEKTGYPVEMLEPAMSLDSDLGIDSIKRVEILSALQEKLPAAPSIGPEHLGTMNTLGEIARFLSTGPAPEPELPASPQPAQAVMVQHRDMSHAIRRGGLSATPVADCDQHDLLKLDPDGEFWLTDDGSTFSVELHSTLSDRGIKVRLIRPAETETIQVPEKISGLVIAAPTSGTSDQFLLDAFTLLKKAGPALRTAAENGGALLGTVARLDGAFGCGSGTMLIDPLSGGLAGLAKTAAKEWNGVICRAIDLGLFDDSASPAQALADELFRSGPLETGLSQNGRVTLTVCDLPLLPETRSTSFQEGDVVVVTGGGRGVTAAAAAALAAACKPLLVLLGRNPEPAEEPDWLSAITEESRIKRALLDNAGKKLHPREIEERYRSVIAGRELRETLKRIAATGVKAIYRPVDIRDASLVAAVISEIRRDHGPIRGIIHGAGVVADRLINDKTPEQFTEVYGTKVEGLRTLLAAVGSDELRFIALFGSTTARFGRSGQVDYAVANEVLNKLAQDESRKRPGCRTVCINWGPWEGGMVTPALKKVFSAEGIGLIGLADGGEFLVREIAADADPVEIVALVGTPEVSATQPVAVRTKPLEEAFSINLTIDEYPFLRSHVLDGKAVLPMAMIVEWLAHGALHGNPGFRFHGFNELRICKGVVFDQETPCTLRVMAGRAEKRESSWLLPVELQGAVQDGRTLLHAKAEIVLATRLPEGIRSIIELPTTPFQPHNGKLYDRERLFHGPDLHGIERVDGCSAKGMAAVVKGAPAPSSWISHPLRSNWLTDPLVLDSAFQLMILWCFDRFGAGSLPCFAARYRQFTDSFPRDGAQVVIRITSERPHGAIADMEFLDRQTGKLVARLEDYECIIDPSLERAFQRNQLKRLGVA